MPEYIKPVAEILAGTVESLGILIVSVSAIFSIFYGLYLYKKGKPEDIFRTVRQRLGRGVLLGLEFLVAADIIHTVAVELTLRTLAVLAIIVLIRTFLSFTLEVELTGNWPWQQNRDQSSIGL
ncbi:MAG: DUF1622 domain-containing protein [Syntrophales bacterium]|jgi:uncharacterized membrane protein|nr:DUF1622 domain-containing protein [Syntrophales bacterium]MDY0045407.1 DUF1622 domain-containing protein [Syntrophales bacterium]